jgi:hypothetical protein
MEILVLCEQGAYVDRDHKSRQYAILVHPCEDPPAYELSPAGHDRKLVCSGHLDEALRAALLHDPMVVVRNLR